MVEEVTEVGSGMARAVTAVASATAEEETARAVEVTVSAVVGMAVVQRAVLVVMAAVETAEAKAKEPRAWVVVALARAAVVMAREEERVAAVVGCPTLRWWRRWSSPGGSAAAGEQHAREVATAQPSKALIDASAGRAAVLWVSARRVSSLRRAIRLGQSRLARGCSRSRG